ncbi:hypothetical protein OIV83_005329 [Microbotryomycetes sp. JL201]|nr:hypothetical protein OIV83_005329 [Microbotryomycetes sp. JL201]
MAKNTVDAHRKQQRKKELARNKQNRLKQKEISLVKKDTKAIEQDIRDLQQKANLSKDDRDQLDSLRAELARVNKAKNECEWHVEKHPEHRHLVFPERASSSGANPQSGSGNDRDPPGLFTKDGKLKHPERSIYYDPVFNPFGVPPPGMPYRERPPTEEEMAAFHAQFDAAQASDGDEEDEEDDDEDIPLPEGPPPAPNDDDSDAESEESDDIPMPEGPPPPTARLPTSASSRVQIARPSTEPSGSMSNHRHQPYPPHGQRGGPRQFAQQQQQYLPHGLPPRPPPGAIQDPLSDEPHKTFQGHQHERWNQRQQQQDPSMAAPPSSAPPPPPPPPPSSLSSVSTGPFAPVGASAPGATISAAPVLRDLKAEATAFVPTHLKKKKASAAAAAATTTTAATSGASNYGLSKIDATGGLSNQESERDSASVGSRPSLMGALKQAGIGGQGDDNNGSRTELLGAKKRDKGKEDYERFEREMAEFL